jgi:MFS family permease
MDNAVRVGKKIVWKEFAPAFVLVLNSLIWYTLTYSLFSNSVSELNLQPFQKDLLFGVYYAAIAASAVIGGIIIPRAQRTGLALWIGFGAAMSILMVTVPSNDLSMNLLFSVLLGASIGFGLPSTLAFFADATRIEKRGFQGGITWSAVGFGILAVATLIFISENTVGLELLAAWRVFGLLFFVLLSTRKKLSRPAKPSQSFRQILGRRELLLYLVPWVMFSLINFIQLPISTKLFGDFAAYVGFIEFAITGVFALIGGFLADRVGRKRIVITGFVLLGIEYAMLSLFSSNPLAWYIFTCFDGAAWGLFAAVFFMSLWGDLAGENSKEKYYILGGLPYLLAGFLTPIVEHYTDFIVPTMSFSIASFFLFVAVLPLIYAPETLPEKVMKDRDLKSYVDKAMQEVQKKSEKVPKKQDKKPENDKTEFKTKAEENEEEYEEAQKLAEKYY